VAGGLGPRPRPAPAGTAWRASEPHTRETSPRPCAHPGHDEASPWRLIEPPPARDGDRPSSGLLGRTSACRPHHANRPTPQPHDGRPRTSIRRRVGTVPHSSPTSVHAAGDGDLGGCPEWLAVSLSTPCVPRPHHFHCFVYASLPLASAAAAPACRSPCVWLTGHVHLRALANGTTRNRFRLAVALELAWQPSWRPLVASYKGPARLPHVVSRVGPKSLIQ
jgi:hypothetical protein